MDIYRSIMSFWDYSFQISNYRIFSLLWIFWAVYLFLFHYYGPRTLKHDHECYALFSLSTSFASQLPSHFIEHSSTRLTSVRLVTVHKCPNSTSNIRCPNSSFQNYLSSWIFRLYHLSVFFSEHFLLAEALDHTNIILYAKLYNRLLLLGVQKSSEL